MHDDLTINLNDCRFASFDLETTGTDTENDRIIEVGIAVFERGHVVERYQQLIDPEVDLPEEITEVTGIRAEELVGKPTLEEVADDILEVLLGQPILAYNHEFDVSLLRSAFSRIGRELDLPPCLDPFPFVWEHFRTTKKTRNAKLATICEYLEIPLESAHRADHDAEAAGLVMLALPEHVDLPHDLKSLLSIQRALMQKVNETFARFRRGRQEKSGVFNPDDVVIELGAAWLYGSEPDPVRALFQRIPDIRDI